MYLYSARFGSAVLCSNAIICIELKYMFLILKVERIIWEYKGPTILIKLVEKNGRGVLSII